MAANGNGSQTEAARQWIRIVRDAAIVVVGSFMLVWQTVFAGVPNPLLVGAGLVLLGLPPAFRGLDVMFTGPKNGNGSKEDRWSHLP